MKNHTSYISENQFVHMNEHPDPQVWNPDRLKYGIVYKNIIKNIRELPGNENSDFIIKFDLSINFDNAIKIIEVFMVFKFRN